MVFLPARADRPALLRDLFNQLRRQFAPLPEDMSN
jgi:hypothetical protein